MLNDDGISWKTNFTNTMYLQNKLWPNDVAINIHMLPITNGPTSQHVTFQKIKYVFGKSLQNSIFIESDDNLYQSFSVFENEVIDFFDTPVDQIVGVTLLAKLDAIGGESMKVDAIEIESWQGENLRFVITTDSPEWKLLQNCKIKDPWWHDPAPRFSNFDTEPLTWDDIGFKIKEHEGFKVIQGG